MKLTKKNILLLVVLFIASILATYFIYDNYIYLSTDNAQIEGHSTILSAKVGGYITKVNIIQGQKVKKGEILIEIDDRDYLNALKQAKYNLSSLSAKLKDAESIFKRTESLFNTGASTKQQYDTSFANVSDLRAQKESLETIISQAELNLEYTKILAPTNGIISKKSAEVGQLASLGTALVGFVDTNERWVTANFKETEIEYLKIGQEVEIDVDAYTNKKFKGNVFSISSATGATFSLLPPDNATGNFTKVVQRVPVRININSLTEQDIILLKNGLSAFIKLKKQRN
ncbi:HlyD family secretion protein [Pigmentibacter sp. JX0631]|uniref:HlyD family secretion protein n=1 Tax=Pigmentibacter sp. JX0631 TaxID=2976982 RepID=UPI0024685E84|nr:HlyD family secretion protein [Pigmentibacter sp. JX0631]WGL59400.1 HlyD family secretion protein [Pigmentibacter sp. JX0631]